MPEQFKLTVTMEAVTPLFLGGANPRSAPELRAPSLRGALRYWLRALVGAAGEQTMRQHEDRLFGVGGDQATAGAVSLRLSFPRNPPQQSYSSLVSGRAGTSYLWFAARGTRNEPERHAIMPTAFPLIVSAPRSKRPEQDLEQAAAVLWLLTRLGGIGARSRRFAGGVQVTAVQSLHNADGLIARLPVRAASPQELVQEIGEGIRAARRVFGIQQLATPAPQEFDVLHPDRCQIFVLDRVFSSWSDAVEAIGQPYQKFRRLRQPDYGIVKQAITGGQNLSGAVERAAFGLPIPFFYRSLGNRTATLQAKEDDEILDRRASPLWIRAVRLSNGRYAVVFTWFQSQFLPPGAQFLLTERGRPGLHGRRLPNNGLISTFLLGRDQQQQSALRDAGYTLLKVSLT